MGTKQLKWLITSLSIMLVFTSYGQKNAIKTSLTGFLLGDFNLSYERHLMKNQSLQLRFGYFQPALSPILPENMLTPTEYSLVNSGGSVQTSLEYRWYLKSEGMSGLYAGPYLRYYGIRANYSDVINGTSFNVEGSLNTVGAGVQLGYHLLIKETFSMDFSFFGAGIDRNGVKLIYTTQDPGYNYSAIASEISEVFRGIPYLEKKLTNEVNKDNLTSRLPFLFPGLRASISIGIAF